MEMYEIKRRIKEAQNELFKWGKTHDGTKILDAYNDLSFALSHLMDVD